MDIIFRKYYKFILPYIDDILVFSQNPQAHPAHLRQFLQLCQQHGLAINPGKSQQTKPEQLQGIQVEEINDKVVLHFTQPSKASFLQRSQSVRNPPNKVFNYNRGSSSSSRLTKPQSTPPGWEHILHFPQLQKPHLDPQTTVCLHANYSELENGHMKCDSCDFVFPPTTSSSGHVRMMSGKTVTFLDPDNSSTEEKVVDTPANKSTIPGTIPTFQDLFMAGDIRSRLCHTTYCACRIL